MASKARRSVSFERAKQLSELSNENKLKHHTKVARQLMELEFSMFEREAGNKIRLLNVVLRMCGRLFQLHVMGF